MTKEAPENCDICKEPIVDMFVDGRTTKGHWANMCLPCYEQYGIGLGVGLGQLYRKRDDTRIFTKTRG